MLLISKLTTSLKRARKGQDLKWSKGANLVFQNNFPQPREAGSKGSETIDSYGKDQVRTSWCQISSDSLKLSASSVLS